MEHDGADAVGDHADISAEMEPVHGVAEFDILFVHLLG